VDEVQQFNPARERYFVALLEVMCLFTVVSVVSIVGDSFAYRNRPLSSFWRRQLRGAVCHSTSTNRKVLAQTLLQT
jgi:hypothetical protein